MVDRRTNIVLLVADDLGHGQLGCMGARDLHTPHIDTLAARGVTLSQYRTASPVCTPARAAFLTGRHPLRSGSNRVFRTEDDHTGMALDEITLAQLLRDAGYRTGMCGKWHLGMNGDYRPTARGFDRFFGVLPGMVNYFTHRNHGGGGAKGNRVLYDMHAHDADAQPVERDGYFTDLISNASCDFIASSSQPYFLYVPFTAPHTPLQAPADPPPEWVARFAQIEDKDRRTFAAMVTSMDDAVGRIVDAIDRRDRKHGTDTLVIFTSDHGWDQRPAVRHVCDNGGLRGGKYQLWDGGLRVPCIVRTPDAAAAQTRGVSRGANCVGMDLFNTMLDYAGVAQPADRNIDGRSLRGVIEQDEPSPHESLCFQYGPDELAGFGRQLAIVRGHYKLVIEGDTRMLFDIHADPCETRDVSREQPGLVDELERAVRGWVDSVNA